jgi:hypothetical protein
MVCAYGGYAQGKGSGGLALFPGQHPGGHRTDCSAGDGTDQDIIEGRSEPEAHNQASGDAQCKGALLALFLLLGHRC